MSKYTGAKCPVCGKIYADGDDIVVCPICGAPHHRECYADLGHCALEHEHNSGNSWQNNVHESKSTEENFETIICQHCGAQNPPDGIFCQVCGVRLMPQQRQPYGGQYSQGGYNYGYNGQDYSGQAEQGNNQQGYNPYIQFASPYGGNDPEMEIEDDVKVKELAAFVGRGSGIYIARFVAASKSRSGLSWNWSSLFFNFLYFFYRKMYKIAAALMVLFIFSLVPAFAYSYEYLREMIAQYGRFIMPLPTITSDVLNKLAVISNFTRLFQIGISIVIALFADRLYLNHSIKRIKKIRTAQGDQTSSYISALSKQGGVSTGMVWLMVTLIILAYLAGCFLISYLILPM